MSLKEKFKNLEQIITEQNHLINQFSGIPFVILIYDPQDQKECYENIEDLKKKLEKKGNKILKIPIGDFIFNYFEKKGKIEELINYDKIEPDLVRKELANVCEKQFNYYLHSEIEKINPNYIFFTNVGGLYPYSRLSNILRSLEKIKIPIIAFYPGKIVNYELYFLNKFKSDDYYRAFRI
ncbi:MAG: BREX protein BrxB domain-containing protein [Promethearchaeota archaeon]